MLIFKLETIYAIFIVTLYQSFTIDIDSGLIAAHSLLGDMFPTVFAFEFRTIMRLKFIEVIQRIYNGLCQWLYGTGLYGQSDIV
jgi:hypothetical protein